eukprot:TRINITY_DN388_c1_g1_i1.p1 TRINITY_DN388_c1_g1~~TRINITY_DN388_c1_g1_i1.p1  ORF type:complete len:435 (+),score=127.89 TRINITY_DN388_c1_g1_i1:88-1392(+)
MPTRRLSPPPKEVPSSEEEDEEEEEEEEEETDPSPAPKTGTQEESSERNQESDDEEDEEEDEEQEEIGNGATVKPINSKPTIENASKTTQKIASSESDSESGSESESESESGFQVKPITTKPMDSVSPQKPMISKAKPKTVAKRSAEAETEKGSKKKAKVAEEDEEEEPDKKKQLFQRLWSEDDEIIVLKGMAEFTKKHGAEPQTADIPVLLQSIKGQLHVNVSNRQLNEKIRRLKKKFLNNAEKFKKGGALSFSKPHEQKTYEVSKKIWGGEVVDEEDKKDSGVKPSVVKANSVVSKKNKQVNAAPMASPVKVVGLEEKKNKQANDAPVASPAVVLGLEENVVDPKKNEDLGNGFLYEMFKEHVDLNKSLNVSVLSDNLLKKGLSLLESSKVKELVEKWESLQIMELEVYLKGVNLVRDQTKMILDALKKSSS